MIGEVSANESTASAGLVHVASALGTASDGNGVGAHIDNLQSQVNLGRIVTANSGMLAGRNIGRWAYSLDASAGSPVWVPITDGMLYLLPPGASVRFLRNAYQNTAGTGFVAPTLEVRAWDRTLGWDRTTSSVSATNPLASVSALASSLSGTYSTAVTYTLDITPVNNQISFTATDPASTLMTGQQQYTPSGGTAGIAEVIEVALNTSGTYTMVHTTNVALNRHLSFTSVNTGDGTGNDEYLNQRYNFTVEATNILVNRDNTATTGTSTAATEAIFDNLPQVISGTGLSAGVVPSSIPQLRLQIKRNVEAIVAITLRAQDIAAASTGMPATHQDLVMYLIIRDQTTPRLMELVPARGQSLVGNELFEIRMTFDEGIAETTGGTDPVITIEPVSSGAISATRTFNLRSLGIGEQRTIAGNVYTLAFPTISIRKGGMLRVRIMGAMVQDAAGSNSDIGGASNNFNPAVPLANTTTLNSGTSNTFWEFTAPSTRPRVLSSLPRNNATDISTNTNITFRFDEPVSIPTDPADRNSIDVSYTDAAGNAVVDIIYPVSVASMASPERTLGRYNVSSTDPTVVEITREVRTSSGLAPKPLPSGATITLTALQGTLIGAHSGLGSRAFSRTYSVATVPQPGNFNPAHEASIMSDGAQRTIYFTYNGNVSASSGASVQVKVREAGTSDAFTVLHDYNFLPTEDRAQIATADNQLFTLTVTGAEMARTLGIRLPFLIDNAEYKIEFGDGSILNAATSNALNDPLPPEGWSFSTTMAGGAAPILEISQFIPPGSSSTATLIDETPDLRYRLLYNQPLTLNTGNISLYLIAGDKSYLFSDIDVTGSLVTLSDNELELELDLRTIGLQPSTSYELRVPVGIVSNYTGSSLISERVFSFTTISSTDMVPPRLVEVVISRGSMDDDFIETGNVFIPSPSTDPSHITAMRHNAPTSPTIAMLFNEPVSFSESALSAGTGHALYQGSSCSGTTVADVTLFLESDDNNQYLITADLMSSAVSSTIENNTEYSLAINSGVIEDARGNNANICYTFHTRLAAPSITNVPDAGMTAVPDRSIVLYGGQTNTELTTLLASQAFQVSTPSSPYVNLVWEEIGDAGGGGGTRRTPGNPLSPTYTELGVIGFNLGNSGIRTFFVWDENPNQVSDTTEVQLIIIKKNQIDFSQGTTMLEDPIVLQSVSTDRYELVFEIDRSMTNPYRSEVSWTSDGTNTPANIPEDRALTTFSPTSVSFIGSMDERLFIRTIPVTLTIENANTGRSYSLTRSITVANAARFFVRYISLPIDDPSSMSSIPFTAPGSTLDFDDIAKAPRQMGDTDDPPALGVCQNSGVYELVQFSPSSTGELVDGSYGQLTQASLVSAGATFLRVRRSVGDMSVPYPGYLQKPVLSAPMPPETEFESVEVTGVPMAQINNISWRLNTDAIPVVSNILNIEIERVGVASGTDINVPFGFASTIIYQAPSVEIENIRQRYCENDAAHSISLGIRRAPGDDQLRLRTAEADPPNPSAPGARPRPTGTFRLYFEESRTGSGVNRSPVYPATPNATYMGAAASSFMLTPSEILRLATRAGGRPTHVGGSDTLFVRLEYVSSGAEDVGMNSACQGRDLVDFVIYRRPTPPSFVYEATDVSLSSGLPLMTTALPPVFDNTSPVRKEYLYCEGTSNEDIDSVHVRQPAVVRPGDLYTWRVQGDTETRLGPRYKPENFTGSNVPGNGTALFTYEVTLTSYDAECVSEVAEVYVTLLGRPVMNFTRLSMDGNAAGSVPTQACAGELRGPSGGSADSGPQNELTRVPVTLRVGVERSEFVFAGGREILRTEGLYFGSTDDPTRPRAGEYVPLLGLRHRLNLPSFTSLGVKPSDEVIQSALTEADAIGMSRADTLFYTWFNVYGGNSVGVSAVECSTTIDYEITVHGLPEVAFSGVGNTPPDDPDFVGNVCVSSSPVIVSSTESNLPPEFNFYVDNITTPLQPESTGATNRNATLDLDTARKYHSSNRYTTDDLRNYDTVSLHKLIYKVASGAGCQNFAEEEFKIHPIPQVDFSPERGCQGRMIRFEPEVSNESVLNNLGYFWTYPNPDPSMRGDLTSKDRILEIRFPNPNPNVRITIEVGDTIFRGSNLIEDAPIPPLVCSNSIVNDVDVGVEPNPVFSWTGATEGREIDVRFYESDLLIADLDSVFFHLREDREMGRVLEGTRLLRGKPQATPGTDALFASHTIRIDEPGRYLGVVEMKSVLGCPGRDTLIIDVLPQIVPLGDRPYETNFESSSADVWAPERYVVAERDPIDRIDTERGKGTVITVSDVVQVWDVRQLSSDDAIYFRNPPGEGGRAWYTFVTNSGEEGEEDREEHGFPAAVNTWLYTPSFDLRNLTLPMLRFNLAYDFVNANQGVVMQYSLDDGRSWEVLGSIIAEGATGINWYTHQNVASNPGFQPVGSSQLAWSLRSGTAENPWLEARHRLDVVPLAERDSVRFRFAVASREVLPTDNDGFALDNFWIGNRSRVVMIEDFSTELSAEAGRLERSVSNVLEGENFAGTPDPYASQGNAYVGLGDALRVTFYGEPTGNETTRDRFNSVNPQDVNARQVFYGVERVPTSVINGQYDPEEESGTRNGAPAWTINSLNLESLAEPLANLTLSAPDIEGSTVNFSVRVQLTAKGVSQGIMGPHRLRAAIVERNISITDTPPSGIQEFDDVMRIMLPSPAGTLITFDGTNTETSAALQWEVFSNFLSSSNPDQLQVFLVAYIQSTETKEIYQVTAQRVNLEQILSLQVEEPSLGTTLQLYPNPTDGDLRISFGIAQQHPLEWEITDARGLILRKGRQQAGIKTFELNVSLLPSGVYGMHLRFQDGRTAFRRFFIR